MESYKGARRGWKADINDKLAYELIEQGVAIICKDIKDYPNKMMITDLYDKK